MKVLTAACMLYLAVIAGGTLLSACAAPPVLHVPAAHPVEVIVVGDCTQADFLIAVDSHGKVVIIGGTTEPSDEDKAWAMAAASSPDTKKINMHVCSDDQT